MPDAFVFDIGGVLLRYRPDLWLAARFPADTAAAVYDALFCGPEWRELDAGALSEAEALRRIAARRPDCAREIYECFPQWDALFEPIPGMYELVRALKARGFALYILSNFSLRCRTVMARFPVFPLFDGALVSAEERLVKPDPRIFARLCEKFGLTPGACFFTDDMPANVDAARAFGIDAVPFTGAGNLYAALRERGVEL